MPARPDYGPRQLADYLGAFYAQVDRARDFGLLPEPDRGGGKRWSAAAADRIHARWPEIKAAVAPAEGGGGRGATGVRRAEGPRWPPVRRRGQGIGNPEDLEGAGR